MSINKLLADDWIFVSFLTIVVLVKQIHITSKKTVDKTTNSSIPFND